MTHDLTTRLTGTLSGLELGLSIEDLNRLRRRDEEQQKMTRTRADLTRKIIGNAREYLFDLVPGVEVGIAVDNSPAIAAAGVGARQTFTLTVVVGDPDGEIEE